MKLPSFPSASSLAHARFLNGMVGESEKGKKKSFQKRVAMNPGRIPGADEYPRTLTETLLDFPYRRFRLTACRHLGKGKARQVWSTACRR